MRETISCFSEQSEMFSLFLQKGERLSVIKGKTSFSDQPFRNASLIIRPCPRKAFYQSEMFSLFLQKGGRLSVIRGKTLFSDQPFRNASLMIKGLAPGMPFIGRRCSACSCDATHVSRGVSSLSLVYLTRNTSLL